MAGKGAGIAWKVIGLAGGIGAGIVARKALTATWKVAAGSEPPGNPQAPDTSWKEAISWAAASGLAVGVARLLATRQLAAYWQKSTGSLPPGVESVS